MRWKSGHTHKFRGRVIVHSKPLPHITELSEDCAAPLQVLASFREVLTQTL